MKGWIRFLFNTILLCICVCTACAATSEALLWTNRVTTYVDNTVEVEYEGYMMSIYMKDAFHYEHENQVMEYDYKTGSIHTYPVSEGELSNLIMIDGNDNGNPIVAAKDNTADEWVLCAW